MAVFAYTAVDRSGKKMSGMIPADTRTSAIDQLAAKQLFPVNVQEQADGKPAHGGGKSLLASFGHKRVSPNEVESFTRELANLLAAGVNLSRSLHLLRREAASPAAKEQWNEIHDDVVGGMSLADSMSKFPRSFSKVYIAMVRAGEAGGFLDVVLNQIAEFRVREKDLTGKVKAAMVYPAVLAFIACGVLVFLLTYFIPKFSVMFDEFHGHLPALTQGIIFASDMVKRYGIFLAIAVVFGVVGLKRAIASEGGRRTLEKSTLSTPVLGKVVAHFALVRFSRMLGTLVGAGVPLVASLRVAREAIGNQTLADTVSHAIEEVQRGAPLSRSLAASKQLFPPSVVEMIAVAEETGRLDKELLRLSASYELELDRRLRMLVALAEPALLFIMAGLIGTVVVGMLLPVFALQDLIK